MVINEEFTSILSFLPLTYVLLRANVCLLPLEWRKVDVKVEEMRDQSMARVPTYTHTHTQTQAITPHLSHGIDVFSAGFQSWER